MYISEQLFLLLTTDKGSSEPWVSYRNFVLAAGLIGDLADHNLITIDDAKRNPRINAAVPSSQVSDPLLRDALKELERRPNKRASVVISSRKFTKPEKIAKRLVDTGVLTEDKKSFLFFTWSKFPTRDSSEETRLRARYQQILRNQAQETPQEAMVITLMQQCGALRRVLKSETDGMKRGQIKETVKEITYAVTSPELDRSTELFARAVHAANTGLAAAIQSQQAAANAAVSS